MPSFSHAVNVYIHNQYPTVRENLGIYVIGYEDNTINANSGKVSRNIAHADSSVPIKFEQNLNLRFLQAGFKINNRNEATYCVDKKGRSIDSTYEIHRPIEEIHVTITQNPKNLSSTAWPKCEVSISYEPPKLPSIQKGVHSGSDDFENKMRALSQEKH